jgi:hypothetical protein
MTTHSPDFDTVLALGASHRYAGGESAVIRVMTGATLTLTSGYVTFDYPGEPRESYTCPLRRGVLPETPPVPPGRHPVHLIVADITDAGGAELGSRVAAVRLVVRDEPALTWDIHDDYPDGWLAGSKKDWFTDSPMGLIDCQACGTFDIIQLFDAIRPYHDRGVARYDFRGVGVDHVMDNTADWFIDQYGTGYLEENGFPSEPVEDAMVFFPTGWAAGRYRTWAGRGADGGLVCLLTDFEVLSENVGPKPAGPALRPAPTASARPPVPAAPPASALDIRAGEAGHLSSPGTAMVEPFGGGTGIRFKIRNVKIDGQNDTVHARGGGRHQLSFDVLHDCPECGNAINQVIVGLAGQDRAQASVWNGMQRSGGGPMAEWVNVSCDIVVPDEPGTYSVRARYAQAYSGKDALGWWKIDRPDGPGPESTIGTIIVRP